jgi:hypothetical protein
LKSQVAPFSYGVPWIDSSVFIYTSQQMIDGQLIYKEVFDHKGFTLYLLNIIGLKIFNGNWVGIWVIQLLCYLITTTFLYKTLRFFYNKRISVLAIVTVLLYQGAIEFGGNISETWSLPFASIALYIFTQYFVRQKQFSIVQLLVLSVTFVLTLFLRPNLVSLWGAFGIVVIFDLVQSKRWKDISFYALSVIIFCLLTGLPFFLYACSKGIIEDSIYGIFTFNIMYSSEAGTGSVLKTFFESLGNMGDPTFIYMGIIVLTYILCSILYFKEISHKKFVVAIIISIFAIAFSCSIGRPDVHYFVQFVPVLMFPVAACFSFLVKNLSKRKWTFAVLFCLILNLNLINKTVDGIGKNYSKERRIFYTELNAVVSQYTTSADKILVMGNNPNIYLFTNRKSSSRFPFIYPIIEKDKRIEEFYLAEFEKTPLPKLIITDKFWKSFNDDLRDKLDRILQNHYEKLDVKLEKGESYSIWKLK